MTPQPASDDPAAADDAQAAATDGPDAVMVASEHAAAEQNGALDVDMHAAAAAQADDQAMAVADDEAIAAAMAYEELSD